MAANDEFPRGFSQAVNAGNGNATTITLPAAPGVTHILESWSAVTVNGNQTTPTTVAVLVTTSDGEYTNHEIGIITVSEGTASANGDSSDSDQPDLILGGEGAQATITIQAGPAFCSSLLRIKWHDV